MATELERIVAATLEARRDDLINLTAQSLSVELPLVVVPPDDVTIPNLHRRNMTATAQRFHELVQIAATLDWSLVQHEYDWTRRRLAPFGITWSHQQALLDTYFDAARSMVPWEPEDRSTLDLIAMRLREIGASVYSN